MQFLPNILASVFTSFTTLYRTKHESRQNSGQALLIVVLIMAVSLVVVLSVSTRSTTDVTQTSYNESALRAFSAAEAGVEEALLKNSGTGGSPVVVDSEANVSYSAVVQTPSSTDRFEHPEPALSGQSRTFWMVSHDSSGNLTCSGGLPCTRASQMEVCWGTAGTPNNSAQTPAVEVTMYYDDTYQAVASPNNYANVKTYRFTADPSSSRLSSNNFAAATSSCSFGNYAFSTGTLNLNVLPSGCATSGSGGCMTMVKTRLLYNTTTAHRTGLRVVGGSGLLPSQGIQVESTGTAGDSTRKVSVFRSFAEPQSVFDAGVFSYNDLTK